MSRKSDKAYKIFSALQKINPEPRGELYWTTPFTLLVAVVLSAQATDKGVNKATEKLFAVADTPEKIKKLGLEKLKTYVKTIGLYNTKAQNIIKLCDILIKEHNSEIPRTREALVRLPGVGRKTANVVMNIAFGEHTIAVDTHVFRVSNRTGMATGATVEQVEEKLEKVVPKEFLQHAHHWLILHGRYICKARMPECDKCPITKECDFYKHTISEK